MTTTLQASIELATVVALTRAPRHTPSTDFLDFAGSQSASNRELLSKHSAASFTETVTALEGSGRSLSNDDRVDLLYFFAGIDGEFDVDAKTDRTGVSLVCAADAILGLTVLV